MEQNSIVFKGTKDGLRIIVDESMSFDELKVKLKEKTDSLKNFLKGTKLFIKFSRVFDDSQLNELVNIIEKVGGVEVVLVASDEPMVVNEKSLNILQDINSSNAKFFSGTLRSGKRIEYDGSVVILGDVNPGSEVIAAGNVIILGSLRGMVHAGTPDNKDAYVAALLFQPTQLRIGNMISRPPDNEKIRGYNPEIATVKDEVIIIQNINTYNDNYGK